MEAKGKTAVISAEMGGKEIGEKNMSEFRHLPTCENTFLCSVKSRFLPAKKEEMLKKHKLKNIIS